MAERKDKPATSVADRAIVSVRTINASRELVWKAWSDPNHLKEWWGPRGFTNTFKKFEFKLGGKWSFIMHGPTGKDFHNECVFAEIVKLEKIVFDHLQPMHNFRVTATFIESKKKTKVTFTMLFDNAAECEEVKKYAVDKNEENFDRLEEELAAMQTPGGPFEISRVLDAPLERVWKIWTDCKHLKHWWGPKGFKVSFCKMDLRPGGIFLYCLKGPEVSDFWGKFAFRDIVEHKRLVYINSFSDENGGLSRHPMHREWPLELLTKISFMEENGKTLITIKWHPINATSPEQGVFDKNRTSMNQGWSGTLSQLTEYLSNVLKVAL